MRDIVVFGNKFTTIDIIRYLHLEISKIDLVVTADSSNDSSHISGVAPVADIAKSLGIETYVVSAPSFSRRDSELFESSDFGLGLVVGWQWLIPGDILKRFRTGVFGFHGSGAELPMGRGRSPLNWSLLLGHKRIVHNLFRYTEEADAGPVFANIRFEVSDFDNIRSLMYKATICNRLLAKRLIASYRAGTVSVNPQMGAAKVPFLRRRPVDGRLDLLSPTRDVYNAIRAQSDPFPGAFLTDEAGGRLTVWDAVPFDSFLPFPDRAVGEVVATFDSEFVMKTLDSSLLIRRFDYGGQVCEGLRFV